MVKHGDVNEVPPTLTLMNMINGAWLSQAIAVAAKLAIPDLLADGPKTSAAVAGEDYCEDANRDSRGNRSPQTAYVAISVPQNCCAVVQTFACDRPSAG
jgi:hypothetical protein